LQSKGIKLAIVPSHDSSTKWDILCRLPREGKQAQSTPDRDEQFKHIAALKAQFLGQRLPVISIDTKKKELIGNYRPEGKIWRRQPIEVEDSFFASYAKCIAVPFGIYDVAKNVARKIEIVEPAQADLPCPVPL
jgi:hypothetical protein